MVVAVGPGQGSNSTMFPYLPAAVRVPREGVGRPRTTPDSVMADKAYSSRGHRALLRGRGIPAVIAESRDQQGHRRRRGSRGGRAPLTDPAKYAKRRVIESGFERFKQWRGLATRYDKLARLRSRSCRERSSCGSPLSPSGDDHGRRFALMPMCGRQTEPPSLPGGQAIHSPQRGCLQPKHGK